MSFANNQNLTVGDLLKNQNGQCYAWTDFFQAALKAHGIPSNQVTVSIDDTTEWYPNDEYFLVENWSKDNGGTSGDVTYEWAIYSAVQSTTRFEMVETSNVNGDYGDLTSTTGLSGQNTTTPAEKVFFLHSIVEYGSSAEPYYDPSYGVRYSDHVDFENTAVHGFGPDLHNPSGGGTELKVRDETAPVLFKISDFE